MALSLYWEYAVEIDFRPNFCLKGHNQTIKTHDDISNDK